MALVTNFSTDEFGSREFAEPAQSCPQRTHELTESSAPGIIAGLRGNEHWAWRLLTDHYQPALERFAAEKKMADPSAVAGTALQEFARSIDSFRGNDKRALDAYIFRTARNRIIDEYRKNRVETVPLVGEAAIADPKASSIEGDVAGGQWVDEVLDLLSSDQREVVELRILEDKSVAETAILLGKNPGTVQVIQHRAIKVLRLAIAAAAVALTFFGVRWATDDGIQVVTPDPAERPETKSGPVLDDDPIVPKLDDGDNNGDVPLDEAQRVDDAALRNETQNQGETPNPPVGSDQTDASAEETPNATIARPTSDQDSQPDGPAAEPLDEATNNPASAPARVSQDPVQTTIGQPPTTVPTPTPTTTDQPPTANDPAGAEKKSAPTTKAPATTTPPTIAAQVVERPTGCEVQISGMRTTGVEVHEPSEVFASSYQLLGLNGVLIAEVSNPQQIEPGEVEFEAVPNGFDPAEVYLVAAVADGVASQPTLCSRRAESAPAEPASGAVSS